MKGPIVLLFLLTSFAFPQDDEPSFVSPDLSAVSRQIKAALLKAACDGEVHDDTCSECPDSGQGTWTIGSIALGHFSSPRSEEALIGVGSCNYLGTSTVAILLGKRMRKWISLERILAFEPEHCMRRRLQSGREFLLCEANEYSRDGERSYSLFTVLVENDQAKFHHLFIAADTTRACWQEKAQQALVKDVDFRDLNGDGLEDISITATYGSFQMTGRRQEQCNDAEEDRIQSDGKASKPFPKPPVVKTYKIDLLFDGNRYTPTPESRAAVALFHWDR